MRSDTKLDKNLRESDSWTLDPVGGKKGTDVARYRLSNRERVPMSLSGKERNHLFVSQSANSFTDISYVSGADSIKDGRSFAIWDFNRDGYQDIVLTNANGPMIQLFQNQVGELADNETSGNFVALRFVGGNRSSQPSTSFSNRDGIGVKIRVELTDKNLMSEYACGEGLAAQNSSTKLFGMGTASSAKSIAITWPSGLTQRAENIRAGELVTFFENAEETQDPTGVERSKYAAGQPSGLAKTGASARKLTGFRFKPGNHAPAKINMYTSMATWCPSCKKHLPELKQLRTRFDDSELSMTGVPIDDNDNADKLKKYVAENDPAYRLSGDWEFEQKVKFGNIALSKTRKELLPTTIIANENGDVLEIFAGVPSVSDIVRLMQLFSP